MGAVNKSSINKKIKKNKRTNKLQLEFLLAAQQTRDIMTFERNGVYYNWDASLLYSQSSYNDYRLYLSTRYIQNEFFEEEFDWFFTELMYRRKSILTQHQHGVKLNAELKNYYILDVELRDMYGYNGAFIPQVILSRKFESGFKTELKLRRQFYHRNNTLNYTMSKEDRVYLSVSKMLGRRFLFNTMLKYQHRMRKGDDLNYRFAPHFDKLITYGPYGPDFSRVPIAKKDQEILTIHPGIMYFVTRKVMVETFFETQLLDSYRDLSTEELARNQFVFGTAIYISAF